MANLIQGLVSDAVTKEWFITQADNVVGQVAPNLVSRRHLPNFNYVDKQTVHRGGQGSSVVLFVSGHLTEDPDRTSPRFPDTKQPDGGPSLQGDVGGHQRSVISSDPLEQLGPVAGRVRPKRILSLIGQHASEVVDVADHFRGFPTAARTGCRLTGRLRSTAYA